MVESYSEKNSLKEENGDNLDHTLMLQGYCEHKRCSRKFMNWKNGISTEQIRVMNYKQENILHLENSF